MCSTTSSESGLEAEGERISALIFDQIIKYATHFIAQAERKKRRSRPKNVATVVTTSTGEEVTSRRRSRPGGSPTKSTSKKPKLAQLPENEGRESCASKMEMNANKHMDVNKVRTGKASAAAPGTLERPSHLGSNDISNKPRNEDT